MASDAAAASAGRGSPLKVEEEEEKEMQDCEEDELGGRLDGPVEENDISDCEEDDSQDLESVLRPQGVGNRILDRPTTKEVNLLGLPLEGERSEVIMTNTLVFSDKLSSETVPDTSTEHVDACLTLGRSGSINSLNLRHDNLLTSVEESHPEEANNDCRISRDNLVSLELDLNSDYSLSTTEHDPFYPYKKMGEIKSIDVSENGSTTGPIEESEPQRMLKQMKPNDFLSSLHGGIPMPKQQACQPKKRKDYMRQCKPELTKREQVSRFAKFDSPSGLLSGLNPGIINHVRNSKQVHSIIQAVVQSEKHNDQIQSRINDQMGRGSKEINQRIKEHNCSYNSSKPCFSPSMEYIYEANDMDMVSSFQKGVCATSQLTTDDDALTLKLSSAIALASKKASSAPPDEFSAHQQNLNSLSLEAANVASQWLDLLQQDIKGRLSALRRSRKRVKNVIQTELPYLLSKEFLSNQENEPFFAESSELSTSTKSISEMHTARWRSLFSQMDKTLLDEGKQLDNWLKQVREMQLHCENGLKFVSGDSSHLIPANDPSKMKNSEALECQRAVWAAAASIYSTCNWIISTKNA